jgi:O-antigen/teichoic acid export membrane protein
VVVSVGLPIAVIYFASRPDADAGALLGTNAAWAALIALLLVPLVWLGVGPIEDLLSRGKGGETWVLAAMVVPVTFLDWTTHNQIVAMLRFARFNVLLVAGKVAYLVVAIALLVAGLGVSAGLLAAQVASVIMITGCLGPILALGRPRIDLGLLRRLLAYGRRVQAGTLFQQANLRLDVLVLQGFRPLSEVGYYVVAQQIAELVITIGSAFQTSVMPLVVRQEAAERDLTSTASVRHYLILSVVAAVINAGVGTLIIVFAFGSKFTPAVTPMLVLLPGVCLLGLATVISGDLRGRERPGLSSVLAGGAALVTVTLDLLLIPPFGVIGAALASVLAYTLYGGVSVYALHRVSGLGVRALVVPTLDDLRLYRRTLAALLLRVRALRARGAT